MGAGLPPTEPGTAVIARLGNTITPGDKPLALVVDFANPLQTMLGESDGLQAGERLSTGAHQGAVALLGNPRGSGHRGLYPVYVADASSPTPRPGSPLHIEGLQAASLRIENADDMLPYLHVIDGATVVSRSGS